MLLQSQQEAQDLFSILLQSEFDTNYTLDSIFRDILRIFDPFRASHILWILLYKNSLEPAQRIAALFCCVQDAFLNFSMDWMDRNEFKSKYEEQFILGILLNPGFKEKV